MHCTTARTRGCAGRGNFGFTWQQAASTSTASAAANSMVQTAALCRLQEFNRPIMQGTSTAANKLMDSRRRLAALGGHHLPFTLSRCSPAAAGSLTLLLTRLLPCIRTLCPQLPQGQRLPRLLQQAPGYRHTQQVKKGPHAPTGHLHKLGRSCKSWGLRPAEFHHATVLLVRTAVCCQQACCTQLGAVKAGK